MRTLREQGFEQNEEIFRQLNEQRASDVGFTDRLTVICECSQPDCLEPIAMTLDEYRAVRERADRFVIVPGHDRPEIEDVIERYDDYAVIEKLADPFPSR